MSGTCRPPRTMDGSACTECDDEVLPAPTDFRPDFIRLIVQGGAEPGVIDPSGSDPQPPSAQTIRAGKPSAGEAEVTMSLGDQPRAGIGQPLSSPAKSH